MYDFKPPIDNPAFLTLLKWGLPLELKFRAHIEVQVVGDGLQRLKQLRGRRAVILSNHSDQYDPEVMFTLSTMLGEDFYWVAAREVFEWLGGLVGWCFQNMGCYSVVRGGPDIESFKMTQKILMHGQRKLVMFPEGEVTRQPDTILPLRPGAIRLFFEAQAKMHEPLFVQPIGIRWHYKHDVMPILHAIMRKIERQLRIVPPSSHIMARIMNASDELARVLEEEYSAKPRPGLAFEQRIIHLREHVLRTMAQSLSLELPENEDHLDWFRHLNNALDQFVNANLKEASAFQKRLHKELAAKVERLRKDLIRIQHLIGITESAEFHLNTPERLANKVARLEREVFGRTHFKGIRVASILVGEPICLMDYVEDFKTDRDHTLDKVTDMIHQQLQGAINKLDVTESSAFRHH